MKKKIVAILATIAAVFGFGFAANTAMAVDYGSINGNATASTTSVTFTFTGLTPNGKVKVEYFDPVIDVRQIAEKTFTADDKGTLKLQYILKEGTPAGTTITATVTDLTTGKTASASATTPATGEGTAKKNETASTGAAIAPYVVAVVLLAAAGISLVAVRKSSAR